MEASKGQLARKSNLASSTGFGTCCVTDLFWVIAITTNLLTPKMEPMTDQSNTCSNIQIGKPMHFYCILLQSLSEARVMCYLHGSGITQRQLYQQIAHPNMGDDSLKLKAWSSLQFADRSTVPTSLSAGWLLRVSTPATVFSLLLCWEGPSGIF